MTKREQFGNELMALAEKYECTTILCSALIGGGEGVCLAKLKDDTVTIVSIFALLIANIPDVYQLWTQVMFSTYLDQYTQLKEKATKGGSDLLNEFKIEGKFKN